MRKFLISLLLAGVATAPAFADPSDKPDWRNNVRAERPARAERAERTERQEQAERPQFNADRGPRNGFSGGNGGQFDRSRFQVQQDSPQPAEQRFDRRGRGERFQQQPVQQDQNDQARNWRDRRQNWSGQQQNWQGQTQQNWQGDRRNWQGQTQTWQGDRRNWQGNNQTWQGDRRRWSNNNNWDRNWRNDNRYDWRHYRERNRSRFHIGIYYDPFGWGYQPFSIGYRMYPGYYSQNFWINDPWQYRLPYAPPGTQWIRYYNDALLVDVYSGEVVDVIRDFFW